MSATSLDPRLGRLWQAARVPVLIGLLVLLAALVIAVSSDRGARGLLDPAAVDAAGSRALAQVLRREGVQVELARDAAQVRAAGRDSTVFVPFPARLSPAQLAAAQTSAADLVLVAPDEQQLRALTSSIQAGGKVPVADRAPRCGLPAARQAGSAEVGGQLYRSTDPAARRCFPAAPDTGPDTGAALVTVPDGPRTISVLGSPDVFTNGALATSGNAALAGRLLGGQPRLRWYLPAAPTAGGGQRSLLELAPPGWLWGGAQLAVAALLAAIWRARRLGPVVAEPLPVVVRAAETVEGRGRLYRRAGARGHAAGALREAARGRLLELLGLGPGSAPEQLLDALAARSATPGHRLRELLYGAAPADDAALVRLSGRLDALEQEVRRS